jgi:hypothetical protein
VHTAFIYARARAEHARRIAIAGLVAVATVTPATAASIDYIGPMPRDPAQRGAWESRGGDKYVIRDETLRAGITPRAYAQAVDLLADQMAGYQRQLQEGKISLATFERLQITHGRAIRDLRTGLNTYNQRVAREKAGLPSGLGRGTGEDGRFNGD